MRSILLTTGAAFVFASSAPALAQHSGHRMPADQPQAAMNDGPQAVPAMAHAMTGALGAYPMSREASGTAWQPDASRHGGLQASAGDWTLMGHALIDAVYASL